MVDFIYSNFEIYGLGRTPWDPATEHAGVLMGCGLTDWWTDRVASCDGDRDSSVPCLGPERIWPHQLPGPMGTGGYFREDKVARTWSSPLTFI